MRRIVLIIYSQGSNNARPLEAISVPSNIDDCWVWKVVENFARNKSRELQKKNKSTEGSKGDDSDFKD